MVKPIWNEFPTHRLCSITMSYTLYISLNQSKSTFCSHLTIHQIITFPISEHISIQRWLLLWFTPILFFLLISTSPLSWTFCSSRSPPLIILILDLFLDPCSPCVPYLNPLVTITSFCHPLRLVQHSLLFALISTCFLCHPSHNGHPSLGSLIFLLGTRECCDNIPILQATQTGNTHIETDILLRSKRDEDSLAMIELLNTRCLRQYYPLYWKAVDTE